MTPARDRSVEATVEHIAQRCCGTDEPTMRKTAHHLRLALADLALVHTGHPCPRCGQRSDHWKSCAVGKLLEAASGLGKLHDEARSVAQLGAGVGPILAHVFDALVSRGDEEALGAVADAAVAARQAARHQAAAQDARRLEQPLVEAQHRELRDGHLVAAGALLGLPSEVP